MSFLQDLLSGNNNPTDGSIEFKSSDHVRYQNGVAVSGHNPNCHRTIKIEKNITGNKGYTITVFNDDSIHPVWRDNIQMSPKRMEIIHVEYDKVLLRGYGYDENAVRMGIPKEVASFTNYGLTVHLNNGEIDICVLHLIGKDVDIVYYR